VSDVGETDAPIDGRRARRERGRASVIDAVFALAEEGKIPVTAELVAERSGVSVASIFRYFDGLDDLQYRAYERFRERYAPLVRAVEGDGLEDRIDGFVERRLDLFEQAGALMALGRLRALEHQPLLEASTEVKAALAAQARRTFATETRGASPARTAELVAVIDAFASAEAWDVLRRTHARSRTQIVRTWRRGLAVLINDWNEGSNR
jgi:AcrR family transcriptional regulator